MVRPTIRVYEAMVELPDKMTIPSVNEHKEPKFNFKTRTVYMYKKPKVLEYQKEVCRQLKGTPLKDIPTVENPLLEVWFTFYFKNRFFVRDVSNMMKSTEDALRDFIGIDDSRTLKIHAEKIQTKDKLERIKIEVALIYDENYTR